MKFFTSGLAFIFVLFAFTLPVKAQKNSDTQTFQQSRDEWRRKADEGVILSGIQNQTGADALRNITESEQVFCYQISNPPAGYRGYMIDGYAISAFCGIINKEIKDMIVAELFMNQDNVRLNSNEDCNIQPKIMLRFVRGIDNTDVLLSSPCYSFAIFYAGRAVPFNAAPAKEIIDAIINPLQRNRAEFVSPALLNQLLPLGVAQTAEQKAALERSRTKNSAAPIKNWGTQTPTSKQNAPSSPKKGWNNLNLGL